MKKAIALFLCLILAFSVSACGNDGGNADGGQGRKVYKALEPEKILTMENVSAIVDYTPVMTKTKSGRAATALYVSEPQGLGDVVQIDLYQPGIRVTVEEVRKLFDTEKEMRPSAEEVLDLGVEAYIALPAIHFMKDGYYVKITTGSGGEEEQKNLLKNTAKTALTNLDELLK